MLLARRLHFLNTGERQPCPAQLTRTKKDEQPNMKNATRPLVILLLIVGVFTARAKADSTPTTFTITGTYGSGTTSEPLSQAGQDFTMTFNIPNNPATMEWSSMSGDDFYLYPMNVSYTMGGVQTLLSNSLVSFYNVGAASQNGGLFVAWCATDVSCATGLEYQWTFGGPQQYFGPEGNPTMLPSSYSFGNQPFTIYSNTWTEFDSNTSGSVSTVATPEPSSITMLLVGAVFAILLLRKMQLFV
jgi:hypothetical protein